MLAKKELRIKFQDFAEMIYNIKKQAENEEQLKWAIYYLFKEIGKRVNILSVLDFTEKTNYYTISGPWLILDLDLNDENIWYVTNVIKDQLIKNNKLSKII